MYILCKLTYILSKITGDMSLLAKSNAQYTPPTQTRLICRVESRRRRRCLIDIHNFFNNDIIMSSHISSTPLRTGSRLPTGAFTPQTRLNSTAESRRRRWCVLSLKYRRRMSTLTNSLTNEPTNQPTNKQTRRITISPGGTAEVTYWSNY